MRKLLIFIISALFFLSENSSCIADAPVKEYSSIKTFSELEIYLASIEKKQAENPNDDRLKFYYGRALAEKANILYFSYLEKNMNNRNFDDMDDLLSGDRKLTGEQEKIMLEIGTKAKNIFEALISKNGNNAENVYYNALSTSMNAFGKSTIALLMEGLIGKYNRSIKILIDDYSPVRASALKLIGRYYFVLPWPKRDLELSVKYLKEAITLNSDAAVNYLFLGDALWEQDNRAEAEYYWSKALKITGTPVLLTDKITNNYCREMMKKRIALLKK